MLTLGHSPDPDDAFMWWPLAGLDSGQAAIDTGQFRFRLVQEDIQSLNERSMRGELDITAMSCAQYPHVRERYAISSCGASMGDKFGPKVVSRQPMTMNDLKRSDVIVAVPGDRTTAFGALALMLGGPDAFRWRVVPFDQITRRVASGEFHAGLIIHEDQLTFESHGLKLIADVAAWWGGATGLPLPLGLNTLRRDLDERFGPGTVRSVTATLQRSILHALDHRATGLDYAVRFGRGLPRDHVDRFIEMYVNQWTIDLGERGRDAVQLFLDRLQESGAWPDPGEVDMVTPGPASVPWASMP